MTPEMAALRWRLILLRCLINGHDWKVREKGRFCDRCYLWEVPRA